MADVRLVHAAAHEECGGAKEGRVNFLYAVLKLNDADNRLLADGVPTASRIIEIMGLIGTMTGDGSLPAPIKDNIGAQMASRTSAQHIVSAHIRLRADTMDPDTYIRSEAANALTAVYSAANPSGIKKPARRG
jgi:hypothetical protein